DGFDHWARELAKTGWMHNHARMWFASIWIFPLRLPWQLGADFFLRHLLDGDAASNTLSWRWVAGLHTPGKTYLASADNIAKNTGGRFRPQGLALRADALPFVAPPAPRPAPVGEHWSPDLPTLLLLHEDDLDGTWMLARGLRPVAVAALTATAGRSPLPVATGVHSFVAGAVADALSRHGGGLAFDREGVTALADHAAGLGVGQVVAPYAPVGPVASTLRKLRPLLAERGIGLVQALSDHDRNAWPHATHGFFRFRDAVM
ncbi:MAG: DNA photolyase, partial [Rhodobacteraceae bacterium PARR1]